MTKDEKWKKDEMLKKFKCDKTWNVTKGENLPKIRCDKRCFFLQNIYSDTIKYDKRWCVTKDIMWQNIKCDKIYFFTKYEMCQVWNVLKDEM